MEIKVAGNSKRFVAYLLDIIPIVLILFAIFYTYFGFDETLKAYLDNRKVPEIRAQFLKERNTIRAIALAVWVLYGTLMDCSRFQGTFGKYLMKIKVTDTGGNQISLNQSLKRNFSKILSVLPLFIGVLWILIDKQHRAWHDRIAKTIVIE